jgi:outer membrane protein assembly factor BamB
VAPHNITSSAVLVAGDELWVTTSNGWDVDHEAIPAPDAPALILVDKTTGELLAVEASGLSARMFHANWTSPAYLRTDEVELGIFGGPDGFCYAFSPTPVTDEAGRKVLREVWRQDANPPEYREKDGEPVPYGARLGPSEIIATPAIHDGLVYCVIGQDPDHGEGGGHLVCIDAKGERVWSYAKINRSMSSLAVVDGMVFAADFSGFMYCLDAKTGEEHWVHDTMGHVWGSPLVADGRVWLGNEDGFLTVIPATREYDKKAVAEIDMVSPMYSAPIAANGVLYLMTPSHLYAIAKTGD